MAGPCPSRPQTAVSRGLPRPASATSDGKRRPKSAGAVSNAAVSTRMTLAGTSMSPPKRRLLHADPVLAKNEWCSPGAQALMMRRGIPLKAKHGHAPRFEFERPPVAWVQRQGREPARAQAALQLDAGMADLMSVACAALSVTRLGEAARREQEAPVGRAKSSKLRHQSLATEPVSEPIQGEPLAGGKGSDHLEAHLRQLVPEIRQLVPEVHSLRRVASSLDSGTIVQEVTVEQVWRVKLCLRKDPGPF
eukprot:6050638-Amphidinium_carterae.1